MALYTRSQLRDIVVPELRYKSASVMLSEAAKFDPSKTYDIFLSHSKVDEELIVRLRHDLTRRGYSVYVDWIDDAQLDRESVNRHTAETLRRRMNNCKALFVVTTQNATNSKWVPWELGYFDGKKGTAAVLPIMEERTYKFNGVEYFELYPYAGLFVEDLVIYKDENTRVSFEEWLEEGSPVGRGA